MNKLPILCLVFLFFCFAFAKYIPNVPNDQCNGVTPDTCAKKEGAGLFTSCPWDLDLPNGKYPTVDGSKNTAVRNYKFVKSKYGGGFPNGTKCSEYEPQFGSDFTEEMKLYEWKTLGDFLDTYGGYTDKGPKNSFFQNSQPIPGRGIALGLGFHIDQFISKSKRQYGKLAINDWTYCHNKFYLIGALYGLIYLPVDKNNKWETNDPKQLVITTHPCSLFTKPEKAFGDCQTYATNNEYCFLFGLKMDFVDYMLSAPQLDVFGRYDSVSQPGDT